MATILDGRRLAGKILSEVRNEIQSFAKKLSLGVVVVGENPVIKKFVSEKKRVAKELGVDFRVYDYPEDISTNELRKRIAVIIHDAKPDGVIVQLPLPAHISTQYILNGVPPEQDVDLLSARAEGNFFTGKSDILPPVVGAVKAFFEEYGIDYRNKYTAVVGAGMLVGKPIAAWLLNEKASFSVVEEQTPDISQFTKNADIIVSGVGKSGLITGDMVKDGAVVIDAGTSVSNKQSAGSGKQKFALAGDIDFDSVSAKASFITPVPGGVGPVTAAMVYKNLFALARGT